MIDAWYSPVFIVQYLIVIVRIGCKWWRKKVCSSKITISYLPLLAQNTTFEPCLTEIKKIKFINIIHCFSMNNDQHTIQFYFISRIYVLEFASLIIELLTLSEHMSSLPVFSGVRVTRSLVLCVMLCRSLFVPLSFLFWPLCCLSFFGFYRFWLPLWYLQTLHNWMFSKGRSESNKKKNKKTNTIRLFSICIQ